MKTEHTPGPWEAQLATGDLVPSVITQNGDGIAEVYNFNPHDSSVAVANARLIAAAPEILEALKLCFEVIDQVTAENMADFIGVDRVTTAWQTARAIIAKAEAL